ncbi:MAG: hypothetical protein Q8L79_00775 [Methylobacter sp.]|uniref:hypothetical protein n=1 Tax=Methylobacter sp. TaxID=2051955 RepID=UPI0027315889|nr:hypothetical protein [Methylobacter sp.]MDP1663629.1 hypothetical protein [Methylobacter sp.]
MKAEHYKEGITMHVNYKLNTNDLDANFLESVKLMFKDKDIIISIADTENDEDFAFGKAIEKGLLSESASREELDKVLYAD